MKSRIFCSNYSFMFCRLRKLENNSSLVKTFLFLCVNSQPYLQDCFILSSPTINKFSGCINKAPRVWIEELNLEFWNFKFSIIVFIFSQWIIESNKMVFYQSTIKMNLHTSIYLVLIVTSGIIFLYFINKLT